MIIKAIAAQIEFKNKSCLSCFVVETTRIVQKLIESIFI
jgi:ribosomal protein S18